MQTPPKYPRTPHWITSPGKSHDDKTMPNSLTKEFVNSSLVITEKLDGGNTALFDGKVFARSTGQEANQAWFKMVKKYHAWKTTNSKFVFYGEDIYALHSIEYKKVREDSTYFLFAVLDTEKNAFLSWDETKDVSREFGFQTVPEIFNGIFSSEKELSQFLEENIKSESLLGGEKEGFVIRKEKIFKFEDFSTHCAKYVRKNHVQTDQHWTKNWRPAC